MGYGVLKYELKFPVKSSPQSAQRSLAQLVAHPLDVREVTSSSLVSSTIKTTVLAVVLLYLCTFSAVKILRLPARQGGEELRIRIPDLPVLMIILAAPGE